MFGFWWGGDGRVDGERGFFGKEMRGGEEYLIAHGVLGAD